ncbi:MAG: hypothetical protein ACKOW2_01285 [Sphingobacteriaceae bacterium]
MAFKKDHFLFGLLAGLLLPALAWVYESLISNDLSHAHRTKIIYLVSLVLNLILVRVAYRAGLEQTGRGLMFISFLSAIVLFYFKVGL